MNKSNINSGKICESNNENIKAFEELPQIKYQIYPQFYNRIIVRIYNSSIFQSKKLQMHSETL